MEEGVMLSQAKCIARLVRLCSVLALAVPAVLRIEGARAEQPSSPCHENPTAATDEAAVATTPEGLKQITRKTAGATNPYKIEKFSKALVNVTPADNGFSTVIGDTLEIVPVTNPATVRPGDEMTVRVLFKGQPLTTNVYATYDGFSKEETPMPTTPRVIRTAQPK
jgi:uncharacterized GH25 family protein